MLSPVWLCYPVDCSPPSSSVHGIFQAWILEWVAIFLLQGIFSTQGSNPHLLCLLRCRWILSPLSHQKVVHSWPFIQNRLYNRFLITYWRSWWILKERSRCHWPGNKVTHNSTYQIYAECQEQWRVILAHYIFYVDVLRIKTDTPWTLFGITFKWTLKWTHTKIHV